MFEVKYSAWSSTSWDKKCYKNGAVFSGMVRDVPKNLQHLLDKNENRCYITIYRKEPEMKKTVQTTLEFTVEEINQIIAKHIGVDSVRVRYVIEEVDADCMGMYPGNNEVTKVRVIY